MRSRPFVVGFLTVAVVATTLLRFLNQKSSASPRILGATVTTLAKTTARELKVIHPPQRNVVPNPNIQAQAVYLIDVESGYPLYAYNENEPVAIASTTKIMTAIIALESYQMDEVVTVSQSAAQAIGSNINLVEGEKITVDSLIKGLLIQSGNDAAIALAEHMTNERFVDAMNEKARLLSLTETKFKDPAGLDDTGHASARDLGILAAYALRNDAIRGIAHLKSAVVSSVDQKNVHQLETSNRLLKEDHPLYLADATGLKTGFTPEAGHSLVASAERNGHQVVSVVLGTAENTTEASAKESRKLLLWALNGFSW
ncbi:D-alanyl-D-alanine carboxypeptidase [Candidatus Berkelbacteria bacterium]|nr:D-alanyl-D-alanine carboxypeptidase [Candidatus Berkelbacteria bacterium]